MAQQSGERPDGGAAEALRDAIQRTLSAAGRPARAGTSRLTRERAVTRERAAQLLDEVTRLGRDASAELARRGQDAAGEMTQRLEALERRLQAVEKALGGRRGESKRKPEG